MLEFSDAPYRFFEAKPSAPLIWLGRAMNRRFILPGPNHRIAEIVIDGEIESLAEAYQSGARLMFVINHPTHSDPQVVAEVHRLLGINSCFMAAYDVFLRSKFCAWSMQKLGNFSIDREGSDRKAMAAAIDVLKTGKTALNIFPEGNVYLTNDRITPFMDGAAFIALKAQAALGDVPVKIIPMSLKFTHLSKPTAAVTDRMLKLATDSGYTFPEAAVDEPVQAVLGLGQHILSSYLEKYGFHAGDGSLYSQFENFAKELVSGVEDGLKITPKTDDSLESRITKARSKIHQLRTDSSADPHPEIDGLADRAILALRIHGYLKPYLTESPTIDRLDETVERIAEDFYSSTMPRTGGRRAMVMIAKPIDAREFSTRKLREAITDLTAEMAKSVHNGINQLNEQNHSPGSKTL